MSYHAIERYTYNSCLHSNKTIIYFYYIKLDRYNPRWALITLKVFNEKLHP